MSPAVIGVETAVPDFIGYTERTEQNGKNVTLTPIPVLAGRLRGGLRRRL